jgi:uracil-DNA glycosylase family 4
MDQVVPRKGLTAADYWGCAVSGFGDLKAQIGLIGLAPGAHGANRTGRPFTGDGAGDFMYPLLHEAGLSSQPDAEHRGDGLALNNLYITNAVKCLPPENKPNADEFSACRPFLAEELKRLEQLKVIVALGQGSFNSLLRLFKHQGMIERLADYPFGHGVRYRLSNGQWLVACYHTSRYNVQTGRMTNSLFRAFLQQVQELAGR